MTVLDDHQQSVAVVNGQDDSFNEHLKIFYARLFPFSDFCKWLNYGSSILYTLVFTLAIQSKSYFTTREFSFTLASEAYLRFHSYSSEKELKADILKLNPVKIGTFILLCSYYRYRCRVQCACSSFFKVLI